MDFSAAMDYVTSAAAATGYFDQVTGHEPKAAPGRTGLTASAWVQTWEPATSGLNSVSMRFEVTLRIFTSMLQEPQDEIDLRLMQAVDAVFAYVIGHFQGLSGSRYVDVFGADGDRMRAALAYAEQDSKKFRIADITIPVVINDCYTETA
jgi:hypothetical protein